MRNLTVFNIFGENIATVYVISIYSKFGQISPYKIYYFALVRFSVVNLVFS